MPKPFPGTSIALALVVAGVAFILRSLPPRTNSFPRMPSNPSLSRPKLLLLGDSLTQTSFEGWGSGLAHRYQRRADVLNRGMSGYNTRWYLEYAEQSGIWQEPGSVALATIFFGANDASLAEHNPHHHVPLEEYRANLSKLVAKTKESFPYARILLITPPPVHHPQRLAFQKQRYKEKATGILERTLESAGEYAEACKAAAKAEGLPVLDLYQAMVKAGKDDDKEDDGFGRFFYDGLHFSKEGHDFVLEALLGAIRTEFPSLSVQPCGFTGQPNNSGSACEGIPSSGPYHDKIDHANPAASFKAHEEQRDAGEAGRAAKRPKTG